MDMKADLSRDGRVLEIDAPGAILGRPEACAEMAERLREGRVLITRQVLPPALVGRITDYLAGVGRSSLPNWRPIEPGCPNFHRLNWNDERSYVKAAFHQFSFFPWNQDVFRLFDRLGEVFRLRNRLCGAEDGAFLSGDPAEGAVARFSAQFYPCGGGYMNGHVDPVGDYQLVVPLMAMSRYGEDFASGGLWVDLPDGERVEVDPLVGPGDVIWFHPRRPHGVAPVDADAELDWTAFKGRWSAVLAVNGLPGSAARAGVEVGGG
ncbi:MAG: hypothetical protein JSS35_06040 [Proteobacteria bacterium]|nr:hypothetical protein [Pseudomonadota bacterium]